MSRVDFGYDSGWRRVRKTVTPWDEQASDWAGAPSLDRRFLWSGWRMLLEFDILAAEPDEPLRALSWGLDLAGLRGSQGGRASAGLFEQAGTIGGLLAVCKYDVSGGPSPADPVDYVYLYDALGNVGQVVDWSHDAQQPGAALAARYEYDPYGGVTKAEGPYASENAWRFSTKQWDDETGLGYWGFRYYDAVIGRWMSEDPIEEAGGLNLYAFLSNEVTLYVDTDGRRWFVIDPSGRGSKIRDVLTGKWVSKDAFRANIAQGRYTPEQMAGYRLKAAQHLIQNQIMGVWIGWVGKTVFEGYRKLLRGSDIVTACNTRDDLIRKRGYVIGTIDGVVSTDMGRAPRGFWDFVNELYSIIPFDLRYTSNARMTFTVDCKRRTTFWNVIGTATLSAEGQATTVSSEVENVFLTGQRPDGLNAQILNACCEDCP
ncbi:MAG: RHS repeat-associated core domain-containing protein [Phycisphaerales bacterium]|nr:RHS repeat-associated core domain-containing protein [Phycisphaerales bacterium]